MELNLRPASVVKAGKRAAQRPYLITAGVCVLTALGAWWQYYENAASETEKVTQVLKGKAEPLAMLEKKIKDAQGEVDTLARSVQPLAQLAQERDYWVNLLAELNSKIPKDYIWITSLELAGGGPKPDAEAPEVPGKPAQGRPRPAKIPSVILMAKGLYLSRDAGNNAGPAVVDEFIANLKTSKLVDPVDDAKAGYVRANDDTFEWAFKFVLPLKLTNPISLQ